MCYVRLMYVFNKHVHATKLSGILIVIPPFGGTCTCLTFNSKKKSYTEIVVVFLEKQSCSKILFFVFLRCKSQAIPMQIPCNSHFPPILRNGPETDLKRRWNGPITDSQRNYNSDSLYLFFMRGMPWQSRI